MSDHKRKVGKRHFGGGKKEARVPAAYDYDDSGSVSSSGSVRRGFKGYTPPGILKIMNLKPQSHFLRFYFWGYFKSTLWESKK